MNNAATTETSNTNEGKNMYTVSPTTGKGFTVTNHITGETIGNDYCEDKVFRSENSANKARYEQRNNNRNQNRQRGQEHEHHR